MDAIFCIPCLLFTDSHSRVEKFRANQGYAFVVNGYSNWKNQGEKMRKHETSDAHLDAKIAQVLFQGDLNIENLLDHQSNESEKRRLADVKIDRELPERIIDVILLLGRQGLAFRGHDENLVLDTDSNSGNFLEVLKMVGSYDERIGAHLRKVKEDHEHVKIQLQKVKKKRKGRGSKITFLSNKSQNKLISIIGDQITNIIIEKIKDCNSWSLVVDSTPDVTHTEQLSICVRIVGKDGLVTEHIFACKEASHTTTSGLFSVS